MQRGAAEPPAGPAADAPHPAASAGPQLPPAVLAHLLSLLPDVKDRVGSAGRVSSSWAAAAGAATTSIAATPARWGGWNEVRLSSLTAFLSRHGGSMLSSLELSDDDNRRGSDTCSASAPPFDLALPQQLRGLRLPPCALPAGALHDLSQLTNLSRLELRNVFSRDAGPTSGGGTVTSRGWMSRAQAVAAAPDKSTADLAHALPRMPALSVLLLGGVSAPALLPALKASAGSASSSNSLRQLASLEVRHPSCITPGLVAELPESLTRLVLAAVGPPLEAWLEGGLGLTDSVKVSAADTPRLGQLWQLQELRLLGIRLVPAGLPALFSGLTRLTSFELDGSGAVSDYFNDARGPLREVLPAVGQLSELAVLKIRGAFHCRNLGASDDDEAEMWAEDYDDAMEEGDDEEEGGGPPPSLPQLCAGLLQENLTELSLTYVSLPRGCGLHMFRAGLRLPKLAVLELSTSEDPESGGFPDCYLTPEDVPALAACCEGGCLRELELTGVVGRGPDLRGADFGVLGVLTTLTYLRLGGATTDGIEHIASLRELSLFHAELQDATLIAMSSQLTCLTSFSVWAMSMSARAWKSELAACCDKSGAGGCFTIDDWGDQQPQPPVCEQLAGELRRVGILPADQQGAAE